jgi:hypothetical protein
VPRYALGYGAAMETLIARSHSPMAMRSSAFRSGLISNLWSWRSCLADDWTTASGFSSSLAAREHTIASQSAGQVAMGRSSRASSVLIERYPSQSRRRGARALRARSAYGKASPQRDIRDQICCSDEPRWWRLRDAWFRPKPSRRRRSES